MLKVDKHVSKGSCKDGVLTIFFLRLSASASPSTASTSIQVTATSAGTTYAFNSASTQIFVSTASPQTSNVYSASGTIQSSASAPAYYNVSSASAASLPTDTRTASSNFTLPSATATATWPASFVIQSSNPYAVMDIDISNLPTVSYNLLNESASSREVICSQQTKFCSTAGCADPSATVSVNFCNPDTMGTRCSCDKGSSNLQQWKWPVQLSDCLNRGNACSTACLIPGGSTAQRTACKDACNNQLSTTCGFPGQYSANYAVSKENQKPSLAMIQGGTAGDGALTIKAVTGALAVVVACALSFVLL
ncbi:hypothetical protein CBS101457_003287 [Exobasidium rhododendri]|nr:hypothetical protein CBS101457_003287 [Exobasidium rhododendri]